MACIDEVQKPSQCNSQRVVSSVLSLSVHLFSHPFQPSCHPSFSSLISLFSLSLSSLSPFLSISFILSLSLTESQRGRIQQLEKLCRALVRRCNQMTQHILARRRVCQENTSAFRIGVADTHSRETVLDVLKNRLPEASSSRCHCGEV